MMSVVIQIAGGWPEPEIERFSDDKCDEGWPKISVSLGCDDVQSDADSELVGCKLGWLDIE